VPDEYEPQRTRGGAEAPAASEAHETPEPHDPHEPPEQPEAPAAPPCPLCGSGGGRPWSDKHGQTYYLCPRCELIHLHPDFLPSRESEYSRYLEHNNSPENSGYVAYLTDFAEHTVFSYLSPGSRLLDFGSGPSPVLTSILISEGYPTESYDPYFAPDTELVPEGYDGVAAVEVAEHLFDPAKEFGRLHRLLRPGGYLFLRTELHDGSLDFFSRWWYRRDRTHVCFYSARSFEVAAELLGMELVSVEKGRFVVMRRVG
jgi:SAM-dependent methyltransferase